MHRSGRACQSITRAEAESDFRHDLSTKVVHNSGEQNIQLFEKLVNGLMGQYLARVFLQVSISELHHDAVKLRLHR